MTNEAVRAHCAEKPGAYEDYPFGETPLCYKVCGRIFAQLYPARRKITVSCDAALADFFRAQFPEDVKPGYHCPQRLRTYMNTVSLDGAVPDVLICTMIDRSYDRVVGKLTRRERKSMPQL